MAKAIITYCDVCLEDDVYAAETQTTRITIDNLSPRTIDLCEVHRKELVQPIEQALQRFGLTDAKAAKRAPVTPAVPGRTETPAKPADAPETPPAASGEPLALSDSGKPREACTLCGAVVNVTDAEGHWTSAHPGQSRARHAFELNIVDTIFECDEKISPRKPCTAAYLKLQGLRMHIARTHGIKHGDQVWDDERTARVTKTWQPPA